ncbi:MULTISPECIES: hypothetical protein [Polaribacter]|uniref:NlpE C-terminal OB domain-containing protein n=1 Tax=Polaribacter sejongensis TaxID=985043 RepID=A0AAJ1VIC9_9FLAO|nr:MULTISPECIES: hypothetical protein [Polaribacter]AUC23224.1 hypothetical protein BTO15_14475 [Polaribacter sejongensis]MDN3620172.1 hypothetical protein [Polaribacter undariae]UWD32574.1 hypothetical protein NQP51_02620 [Polaribacter undariae]
MKLKDIFKLLLVLFVFNPFLISCKEKQKKTVKNFTNEKIVEQNSKINTDSLVYSEKDQSKSDYTQNILRGRMTLGHEVSSFSPCGDNNEFWILAEEEFYELYYNLTKNKEPYSPIFVSIEIIDKGKSEDGFAADYESTYEVVNILEARNVSDIDCE